MINLENDDLSAAVEMKDVRFSYEKGKNALDGISLTIKKGECFGILGPSGAGKSTLLLHLNGILRGEGVVKINGIEVSKKTISEIRQKVGLVFQNPDDQLFSPTVEEDIAFGPANLGLEEAEVRNRVKAALKSLNLEGFEKKTSHHLSFGERKRVALATVLSMQPEIIAFDEPFSNLDPAMVKQLVDTINSFEATVILVSQAILPTLACCDRLAVLKDGKITALGDAREIISDRDLLRSCDLDFYFYCDMCRILKI
ncbi:MAG: ABC transporter ATP-binding protein [Candidatus Aminicenantes bacterium]|nr:ABC transporter ATP-binding protein [Candidatus Aminicenantes bacterium]